MTRVKVTDVDTEDSKSKRNSKVEGKVLGKRSPTPKTSAFSVMNNR